MKRFYCLRDKILNLSHQNALNYQSVLIVTYGRSGSTLLQGLLNSISGCLIRGENNHFCYDLFQADQHIMEVKEKEATSPTHPFYGAHLLDENIFLKYTQDMVKDLLVADKREKEIVCYGFKEVRYINILDKFFEYLDFLNKIFPNVAFVFLTRKIEDTIKSGWWPERNKEETIQNMEKCNSLFANYQKMHSNSYLITYEDITSKSTRLHTLFEFLGASYSEEVINQVLARRHSYTSK